MDLEDYEQLQWGEILDEVAFKRMLDSRASRHYEEVAEPLPKGLEGTVRRRAPYDAIFLGEHAVL